MFLLSSASLTLLPRSVELGYGPSPIASLLPLHLADPAVVARAVVIVPATVPVKVGTVLAAPKVVAVPVVRLLWHPVPGTQARNEKWQPTGKDNSIMRGQQQSGIRASRGAHHGPPYWHAHHQVTITTSIDRK